MVVVVGPEIELTGFDAVVGIRIGDARLHRTRPRLANRDDRLDGGGGRGLVVGMRTSRAMTSMGFPNHAPLGGYVWSARDQVAFR